MNHVRTLPLPPEQKTRLDVWLAAIRLGGVCVAIAYALVTAAKLTWGRPWGPPGAVWTVFTVVLGLALVAILALRYGRSLFYYVPPVSEERYFVLRHGREASASMPNDEWLQNKVSEASAHDYEYRDTLLAVKPLMSLLVLGARSGGSPPEPMGLLIYFKGEPTAQGACQLNWLFGRACALKESLVSLRAELEQVRRDHPDLPFDFEIVFPRKPKWNF